MAPPGAEPPWARRSDEELLDLRFRDLRVRLEETPIVEDVRTLHAELAARGLRLRPACWLSSDWFSPSGVPGIALPFYLAHPRLRRLELDRRGELYGARRRERMALLRHEAGHAVDTAYELEEDPEWRRLFGSPRAPYRPWYEARAGRREYVLHMERWYAQSHPSEDFAETFAVWLRPRSDWRSRYRSWPALEKLEYVDRKMRELAGRRPRNAARHRPEILSSLTTTLRAHYRAMRRHDAHQDVELDERGFARLFGERSAAPHGRPARRWLADAAPRLARLRPGWDREARYGAEQVLHELGSRAHRGGLVVRAPDDPETLERTLRFVESHVRRFERNPIRYAR